MDSLCHPWFTTTNLSYRFPIFETSATALCGTTGILVRILLLGNLYIITLGTLRTFTWKTWEPWGNLYNTTLGTLTTFTWETLESWGNLYNATLESLRKPWQYNIGTLENLYNVTLGTLREPYNTTMGTLENLGTFRELWGNLEGTLRVPFGNLEGTLREPWQSNLGNLIETFTMSPWEPGQRLLGNLYIMILGTLTTFTWKTWEPCREPWRNLEGTFWEPFGNLLGTFWEPFGNLEGTLGNLYLGTFTWEYLGTLGESVLELLRSAPKPLLWLKTPKLLLLGKKSNAWVFFGCFFGLICISVDGKGKVEIKM